jgi:outer membrane protein assembly factor BamD
MKLFFRLTLFILFSFYLQACDKGGNKISKIKEINQELEMSSTYKEGFKALQERDNIFAAKKFLEAELLFPQSIWAAKSALMAAYAYYNEDYYSEAVFNLERYIRTYPKDQNLVYAYFLLAMCNYETIEDETKDLRPIVEAKKKFEFIIKNYPNSEFSVDAKFKVNLINDLLASKEMYIGRHYIKKEKWIAAINRFKYVIENYDTTIYTEEAIHRLVEIYYHIGLLEESKKYASLLGYNHLSGEWYKKSYIIFNKKYKTKTIKQDKKKKIEILKKIKNLF